jgi:hypothetical protein
MIRITVPEAQEMGKGKDRLRKGFSMSDLIAPTDVTSFPSITPTGNASLLWIRNMRESVADDRIF